MRRCTVGVVVATALLAGCSSAPEASHTLPTTAAPTTAQAATTLPPLGPPDLPMPAAARVSTAAGAESFTRYYLDLINRTSRVMDATDLRTLSDNCDTCTRIAADTDKDRASGYHYEGGNLTITSAAPVTLHDSVAEFAFVAAQEGLKVVGGDGSVVPSLSSRALTNISSGAAMRWDDQRHTWLMTQLTLG